MYTYTARFTDPWSGLVVKCRAHFDFSDVWNDLERVADIAVDDGVGEVTVWNDLECVADIAVWNDLECVADIAVDDGVDEMTVWNDLECVADTAVWNDLERVADIAVDDGVGEVTVFVEVTGCHFNHHGRPFRVLRHASRIDSLEQSSRDDIILERLEALGEVR